MQIWCPADSELTAVITEQSGSYHADGASYTLRNRFAKLLLCIHTTQRETHLQQSSGKSSLYLRPVRSVVIIFTRTELMCFGPISFIRAIKLFRAWVEKKGPKFTDIMLIEQSCYVKY